MKQSSKHLLRPLQLTLIFSLAVLSLSAGVVVFDQTEMQTAMAQTPAQDTPPDRAPTNVGLPLPGASSSSQSSVSQSINQNNSISDPQNQAPRTPNLPVPVTTTGGDTTTPQIDPTQVATTTPRSGGLEVAVILITLATFGGVYYLYQLKDKKDKLTTVEKKIV
jgi:cytoskeletal protein RodZ